ERTLEELLRRPEIAVSDAPLAAALAGIELGPDEASEVEAEVKYAGYVARQAVQVDRMRRLEARTIPAGFDATHVRGLSNEARDRIAKRRPLTVGEASRLPGVTPADVQVLLAALSGAR
ncbi:MAG: hypothetical protein RL562_3208, partial [Planctomycetota bacterium]